mgnify:CR=1 FL=1|jgi:hypothetical protein
MIFYIAPQTNDINVDISTLFNLIKNTLTEIISLVLHIAYFFISYFSVEMIV